MVSLGNFSEHIRNDSNSPQWLPKIEKEGTLSNLFYEVSITLLSKERTSDQSFVNTRAKIFNKILANQIQ